MSNILSQSWLIDRCHALKALGSVTPPHSPTPIPVLTVSGAAGAKANS